MKTIIAHIAATVLAAALLCPAAASATASPDREREELFIIYKGANPVGFSYTTLAPGGDGGESRGSWQVESEIFIQFSVQGVTLETDQKSIEVISPDFKMLKMFRMSLIGGREYRLWAEKRGETLHVTSRFGGKEFKKEMPYPEDSVPLSVLPLYLADKGFATGELVVNVLSASHTGLSTADMKLKVLGEEPFDYAGTHVSVRRMQTVLDGIDTTYKMDSDGNIYEAVQPTLDMVQKRIELSDFYSIEEWLPWNISQASLVAADKRIPDPEGLSRLDVILEWPGGMPSPKPELWAVNQSVQKTATGGFGARVVLSVTRPHAPALQDTGSAGSVLAAPESCLRADSLIQSEDPGVIAAAQRASEGADSEWAAAVAIARWIHENIQPDPTSWANEPSAAVTLESGIGMDKHAAILLAAMARARGAPARICAGKIYTMGLFVNHYWIEVFAGGRWFPLDATSDDPASPPPLLIKLAHADSMEKAAALLAAADKGLLIKIKAYKH